MINLYRKNVDYSSVSVRLQSKVSPVCLYYLIFSVITPNVYIQMTE